MVILMKLTNFQNLFLFLRTKIPEEYCLERHCATRKARQEFQNQSEADQIRKGIHGNWG